MVVVDKCPCCGVKPGPMNAKPHCPTVYCRWNKCQCGVVYDRATGNGLRYSQDGKTVTHYPAKPKPKAVTDGTE